ncbi:hypothetical protein diail_9946 [Diaporthe ilicicola]|nr:hypothetical protein diail_9946 [Diaporthe ilicicola]
MKFLSAALTLFTGCNAVQVVDFPNNLTNGSVDVEFTTGLDSYLDGPKLTEPANGTTFEWWYFDAVSSSSNASIVVVLYNNGPDGFLNTYFDGPFSLSITGAFPNGSLIDRQVPATGAVIKTDRSGISAEWKDAGVSFTGSNLARGGVTYSLTVDSPDLLGVRGNMTWRSLAPPHYPCSMCGSRVGPLGCHSMDKLGAEEEVMPHIGWSNAIPDATVSVELTFNGTDTVFFDDGIGYHDKNWGDQPLPMSAVQWYWGHGRVGPYSIVLFDSLDATGREYTGGYVAEDGRVLEVSCTAASVVARPWGSNSEYPPTAATGPIEGLGLQFQLGDGSKFLANFTSDISLVKIPGYLRTIGTVEGGIEGDQNYTGRMIFEQFTFIPAKGATDA